MPTGDEAGDRRRRRLQLNEYITAALNERLEDRLQAFRAEGLLPEDPEAPIQYLCACADPACRARFTMTPDQYAAIHARPDDYVVAPGHEEPEIESVVDQVHGAAVLVVRKKPV